MGKYNEDTELTHGEVIAARKQTALDEYSYEVESMTRNITLQVGDIDNSILTDQFFERTDVNEEVCNLLLILTVTLKDKLEFINA